MTANPNNPDYQDRSRLLVAIGVPLLLGGIAAGLIGPIELYTFYLFSEGGRFHYMEMLGGLPLEGYHFAVMAGIPLLITWGVAVLSKRHFRPGL